MKNGTKYKVFKNEESWRGEVDVYTETKEYAKSQKKKYYKGDKIK